jgi:hypothetical protein
LRYPRRLLNSKLQADCYFDFKRFLKEWSSTTVGYGSKFWPVNQLQLILNQHPNFLELCAILADGMDYQFLTTIPEEAGQEETIAMVECGTSPQKARPSMSRKYCQKMCYMDSQWPYPQALSPDSRRYGCTTGNY